MNNFQKISLFFVLAAASISILPIFNVLTQNPATEKEGLFETSEIERVLNYLGLTFLKQSFTSERVVTGQEGYLFLGNYYHNVLSKSGGHYQVSQKRFDFIARKYLRLQRWYERKGVKFLLAIAPNKASVYPDKLPVWLSAKRNDYTGGLVGALRSKGVHFVEMAELLKQARKEGKTVYTKLDSHWTAAGWAIAYDQIIKRLNETYELDLRKSPFTLGENNIVRTDLLRILKLEGGEPENISKIEISKEFLKVRNIQKSLPGSVKQSGLKSFSNQRYHLPYQLINKAALNEFSILMFVDSFSLHADPLMAATFTKVAKYSYEKTPKEYIPSIVAQYSPQIVLYLVVERYLGEGNYLKGW